MVDLRTKVRVPEGVHFQKVSGEAVILDTTSGKYFGLDPVGTRMWSLLSETGSLALASQVLLEEYDVSAAQLNADLIHLVDELAARGLLQLEA